MNTTTAFPFTDHDRFTAQQTLASVREAASTLYRELRAQLREAEAFTDPHLTAEGLADRREKMRDAVRERAQREAATLRAQADTAVATLKRQADRVRPKVDAEPAALMRHEQAWGRVKMRLDAGMTVREVLDAADVAEVLALAEWGPTWLQTARPVRDQLGQLQAPDLTSFHRAIDDRLATLSGGGVASALKAAQRADVDAAAVGPLIEYAEDVAAGRNPDPMAAALGARIAEQAATGASLPDEDGQSERQHRPSA